ncbi:MAG: hypothetical protein KDD43_00475 [Bdellovibrionales bacterium]|nr:hypothetical protein [Bdellovibrionales bacterium]
MSKQEAREERNAQIREKRALVKEKLEVMYPNWDKVEYPVLYLPGHSSRPKITSCEHQHHIHKNRHLEYRVNYLGRYKGPFPVVTIEPDHGITIVGVDPEKPSVSHDLFIWWREVRLEDLHFVWRNMAHRKTQGEDRLSDKSVR